MNTSLDELIGSGLAPKPEDDSVHIPYVTPLSPYLVTDQLVEMYLDEAGDWPKEAIRRALLVAQTFGASETEKDKIIQMAILAALAEKVDLDSLFATLTLRQDGKFTPSESQQLVDGFLSQIEKWSFNNSNSSWYYRRLNDAKKIVERGNTSPKTVDAVIEAQSHDHSSIEDLLRLAACGTSPKMAVTLAARYVEDACASRDQKPLLHLQLLKEVLGIGMLDWTAEEFFKKARADLFTSVIKQGISPVALANFRERSIQNGWLEFLQAISTEDGIPVSVDDLDAIIEAPRTKGQDFNLGVSLEAAKIGCSPSVLEQLIARCLERASLENAIEFAKLRTNPGLQNDDLQKLLEAKLHQAEKRKVKS
jgi:hypothetical protein